MHTEDWKCIQGYPCGDIYMQTERGGFAKTTIAEVKHFSTVVVPVKTRPLFLGLIPLVVALVALAHSHAGAGVSIGGPALYQSQQSPSAGIPLSETVFLLSTFVLAIHLFSKLRLGFSLRVHTSLVAGLMIAILALGMAAYALPSHEVSVTPPVSFTFFFGGDTGYYSGSLTGSMLSNRLIQPDFFLDLGDIGYNGTTNSHPPTGNEVDWCNFIKANVHNRLGNPNFPYVFVTGNHEDGNPDPANRYRDGYIDAFVGNNCLPLSAFNSQSTAGNGYINFIGSGLCTESTTCYGKEGYFDYPASNPIARFITITVADTVGNSTDPNANVNFNYCPLSVCGNQKMDAHWNWLTGVVSSAKNASLWTFVAFHKPCLSPDLATGCEGNGDYGPTPNNLHNPNYQLETYLISHGVDVLLNAHSHAYARSKQLSCLGPTEPTDASTVGITYSQSCVTNDGSSGVYTRGAGTVEVIQGAFSQRSEQLNFSRADINYFAKAMSARGTIDTSKPGTLNDCCWVYGRPMNMTSGNGVGMMTVNATQISFNFLSSIYSHNVAGATQFTDSFAIRSPSHPPKSTTPNELLPLIVESSIVAVIGVVAVDAALVVRRRKRTRNSKVTAFSTQPSPKRDAHYSIS
jgi:hypothetical protein